MPEQPRIIDAEFTVVREARVQTPPPLDAAALLHGVRPVVEAIRASSRSEKLALARGAISAIGLVGAGALLAAAGARARRHDRSRDRGGLSIGVIGLAVLEHVWHEARHRD